MEYLGQSNMVNPNGDPTIGYFLWNNKIISKYPKHFKKI